MITILRKFRGPRPLTREMKKERARACELAMDNWMLVKPTKAIASKERRKPKRTRRILQQTQRSTNVSYCSNSMFFESC